MRLWYHYTRNLSATCSGGPNLHKVGLELAPHLAHEACDDEAHVGAGLHQNRRRNVEIRYGFEAMFNERRHEEQIHHEANIDRVPYLTMTPAMILRATAQHLTKTAVNLWKLHIYFEASLTGRAVRINYS